MGRGERAEYQPEHLLPHGDGKNSSRLRPNQDAQRPLQYVHFVLDGHA